MTIKVIARKIREPEQPYLHICRQNINKSLAESFRQNKKCVFISGITGYGKTVAVRDFINSEKSVKCWYSLDEWDKDPVTFLNYIYHIFQNRSLISNELSELFSQPLNSEKHIKNFIGLLSNELEGTLQENTFLVLDNFQEVHEEEAIKLILQLLLNYCPEKLKLVVISQQPLPEEFYPYVLKHELEEFKLKGLLLTDKEASDLLARLEKSDTLPSQKLLEYSQKSISLFLLMAQSFEDNNSLEKFKENKILKNALNQITAQIYNNFSNNLKDFIHHTLFLPRIKKTVLEKIFNYDFSTSLETLTENTVLSFDQESGEYIYTQSFAPVLTEHFLNLPEPEKEAILKKIISLVRDENPEVLMSVLFKAKAYQMVLDYLAESYEYYFKNYLFNTLEHLIQPLKGHFSNNNLLNYLEVRLYRSTGQFAKALKLVKSFQEKDKTSGLILEEGISEAASGFFDASIEKLTSLENENKLELNDYLTLINCLGISYLHNHNLDSSLNYFLKAIELRYKLPHQHDLLKVYHNLGLNYTWLGDFNQAISAYEQSLYLAKNLKILPLAMTYNNLAIIFNLQGEYDRAYQNCIAGLEIVEKTNNIFDKIHLYLTLAEAYRGLKNVFKVQESLQFLDELLIQNPSPILDALLFKQKAYISLEENNPQAAKEYIIRAMHIRKMSEGDPAFLEYQLELAIINYYAGNYSDTVKDLNKIEEGIKQGKHQFHLARTYLYLFLAYNRLDDKTNSEKYRTLVTQIIDRKQYRVLAERLESINYEKSDTPEALFTTADKKATPVPVRDDGLKIFTFGQMEMRNGEKEINKKDWQGKKTKMLLVYLLLNKKGVSKELIFQTFFPEGDKSRSALHVLMNRLRGALTTIYDDTEVIQFSDDLYHFNFSIDYWWDAARFEYLLGEARQTAATADKYAKMAKVLDLYQNHFMIGFELENWIFSTQEHYRQLAYKSYEELNNYYYGQQEYEKQLELSNHFFRIDTCYEKACMNKMTALAALGRKKDAFSQYALLEAAMKKILNDEPSEEMKSFRDKIRS